MNLQITLETLKKSRKGFVVVFIDLKKSFDRVRYSDIFNWLKGIGALETVVQLLLKIYEHDDTKYKINGEISKNVEN